MPSFDVDQISIDPDDFINACSSWERTVLVNELYNRHPEKFNDIIEEALEGASIQPETEIRSDSHRQFLYHLNALKKSWYEVSKEDVDIITILAKKYGAL
jgi:hypothetical protein